MDIFGVLSFVGGLAMFLYGMSAMGDGLTKLSGGKLEYLLEKLTSKRIMAVLLGAGVTAVIQSSSATTVMVVGFVNSGIMKLNQAVGIIMGANIGTTITSWILSLTGIQGDNVFIKMLNPSSFSPILAIIGVFMLMLAKSDKKKNVGTLLTGFSILMFGMHTMSSAVSPLADVPEFTGLLVKFSIPVLGVLAGTILTAVIQSSSASVGILQALCATGSVSYAVAIPIIMGQNIGTCITAMLSSIGTSRNARRTAMVHLYFNIIGTVLFLVLFYGINAFVHFPFLETSANAAGIAIVHSGFNIFLLYGINNITMYSKASVICSNHNPGIFLHILNKECVAVTISKHRRNLLIGIRRMYSLCQLKHRRNSDSTRDKHRLLVLYCKSITQRADNLYRIPLYIVGKFAT